MLENGQKHFRLATLCFPLFSGIPLNTIIVKLKLKLQHFFLVGFLFFDTITYRRGVARCLVPQLDITPCFVCLLFLFYPALFQRFRRVAIESMITKAQSHVGNVFLYISSLDPLNFLFHKRFSQFIHTLEYANAQNIKS